MMTLPRAKSRQPSFDARIYEMPRRWCWAYSALAVIFTAISATLIFLPLLMPITSAGSYLLATGISLLLAYYSILGVRAGEFRYAIDQEGMWRLGPRASAQMIGWNNIKFVTFNDLKFTLVVASRDRATIFEVDSTFSHFNELIGKVMERSINRTVEENLPQTFRRSMLAIMGIWSGVVLGLGAAGYYWVSEEPRRAYVFLALSTISLVSSSKIEWQIKVAKDYLTLVRLIKPQRIAIKQIKKCEFKCGGLSSVGYLPVNLSLANGDIINVGQVRGGSLALYDAIQLALKVKT